MVPTEPCLSPTKDLVYSKTAKQCLEEISGRMSAATCAHTHLHTVKHTQHTQHTYTHTGTDSLCRPLVPCCYRSKKKVRYDRWTKAGLVWEAKQQNVFICASVYFSMCGTMMWQLIAEDRCLWLRLCSHTYFNSQSVRNKCKLCPNAAFTCAAVTGNGGCTMTYVPSCSFPVWIFITATVVIALCKRLGLFH